VANFYTGLGNLDLITSTNFHDYRLWGLGVVGGGVKFWASPLTCIVGLTTLSHYRVSVLYRILHQYKTADDEFIVLTLSWHCSMPSFIALVYSTVSSVGLAILLSIIVAQQFS